MTIKRIQGITSLDLLMIISLFSIITIMVFLLAQATFGEDGDDIGSKAIEMISNGEDTTESVEFILGGPTPLTLTVNDQAMELGIHFSTERGCMDGVLHVAMRDNENYQVKNVYFENEFFTPKKDFTLNGAVIEQIESVCLGSLDANKAVTFDISVKKPKETLLRPQ